MTEAPSHHGSSLSRETTWIGMLRAIGPETHKKMSMRQLRQDCESAGLCNVSTYIASGNLLFRSNESGDYIEALIKAVLEKFGLNNTIFLRRVADLQAVIKSNPFPKASIERPEKVLVSFMKQAPEVERLSKLLNYSGPERIVARERELYIDYVTAVGKSKVAPGIIERRLGMPGTARNWNTVVRLVELARQIDE
jgi:uncharacterized protein (DUF1697 family)